MERAVAHYHMETAPFGVQEQWALSCDGSDHSLALVAALSRRFRASSPRLKITVVHVNVGLSTQDYSKVVEEAVRAFCEKCAMPCVVVRMKEELGVSADDVHAASGALERSAKHAVRILSEGLVRITAHKLGVHKIATSDSLNDVSGDLISRWCSMDVGSIVQAQPWSDEFASSAGPDAEHGWSHPRVCPFVEISDDELDFYFRKCLDFVESVPLPPFKCPYYAERPEFVPPLLHHLLGVEKDRAGTLLRMVRGFDQSILSIVRPEYLQQMQAGTLQPAAADPTLDIIREGHSKKDSAPGCTEQDRLDDAEERNAHLDAIKTHPCAKCGIAVVATASLCPCCRLVEKVSSAEKKADSASFELQPRIVAFEPSITLTLLKASPTAPGEGSRARKRNAWKRRQEEAASMEKGGDKEAKEPETKKAK